MDLSGGPMKTPAAGEKPARSRGPCPLGAAMGSSAISEHDKYCHNGAWPSPHKNTAAEGPLNGIMAFISGPQEPLICREERPGGPRSSFFGGSHALVWLHGGRKYCQNGGTAFAR
jgi:hypothetical protein